MTIFFRRFYANTPSFSSRKSPPTHPPIPPIPSRTRQQDADLRPRPAPRPGSGLPRVPAPRDSSHGHSRSRRAGFLPDPPEQGRRAAAGPANLLLWERAHGCGGGCRERAGPGQGIPGLQRVSSREWEREGREAAGSLFSVPRCICVAGGEGAPGRGCPGSAPLHPRWRRLRSPGLWPGRARWRPIGRTGHTRGLLCSDDGPSFFSPERPPPLLFSL